MSKWRSHARGCLVPLLAGASTYLIVRLMSTAPAWPPLPPWSPLQRVVLALLLSGLNVLLAPAGEPRRRLAGLFLCLTTGASVVAFGEAFGLGAGWQRWLAGLALAMPFFLLFAANTPGFVKTRLDARRQRRSTR